MKKEFLKKENNIITKLILAIFASIILSMLLELTFFKKVYGSLSIDRVFILTMVFYFISIHFIIKLKTLYEYIYKKRFIIALILFIFCILLGYSGSSISMYNQYIYSEEELTTPILGKAREIRSDEWAVNTPLAFSQNMQKDEVLPYLL